MNASSEEERPDDRGRTCLACGEKVAAAWEDDLVRLVVSPSGEVAVDVRSRKGGRGLWIHPRPACVGKLPQRVARLRKSGATAFKADPASLESLTADLVLALERKARSLLGAAKRAGYVVAGAQACMRAADRAELVVVARDARAGGELGFVADAVREGRAVAFLSKEELYDVLGPVKGFTDATTIGVALVTDERLARVVGEAIRAADALRTLPPAHEGRARSKPERRAERAPAATKITAAESAFRTDEAALSGGALGTSSAAADDQAANEDVEPAVRTGRSRASADVE